MTPSRHIGVVRGAVALVASVLVSSVGAGTAFAAVGTAPSATTGQVTSVRPTVADVAGTVNPNGSATTWYFQYGPSTNATYGSTTAVMAAGSARADADVTASLTGLAPATSYHYRIVASSGAGTTVGGNGIFNTSAAPTVVSGAATDLTASSATLNGVVNPEGLATRWYFRYGLTTAYGSKTATKSIAASPNDSQVSSAITDLAPQQTYHFRLEATSRAGTAIGVDFTLVTGLSVTLNTSESTVVYGGFVPLSGTVASGLPGQRVTVESEGFAQTAFSGVAVVTTGTSGVWSYAAQPTARTTYKAVANGGSSSPLVVGVRPAVSLSLSASGMITTRVIGSVSFAAHVLQLQRLSGGLWVTWKHVSLNAQAKVTFATSLPTGRTEIRMAIAPFVTGVDQAAPGYLAGFSHAVSYRLS